MGRKKKINKKAHVESETQKENILAQNVKPMSNNINKTILFESGSQSILWLVFSCTMLIFWILLAKTDMSFYHFLGATEKVNGTVIQSAESGYLTPLSSVTEIYFKFIDKKGNEYKDLAYTTSPSLEPHDKVKIIYPPNKPYLAKIEGYSREPYGPFAILFFIIPLSFLIIILEMRMAAVKALDIIKQGIMTHGKYHSTKTEQTAEDKSLHTHLYTYNSIDGKQYETTYKTDVVYGLTTPSYKYPVIYDKNKPSENIFVKSLPCKILITEDGELLGDVAYVKNTKIIQTALAAPHLLYAIYRILTNL